MMIRKVCMMLMTAVPLLGNPVLVHYITEVKVGPGAEEWIEIFPIPQVFPGETLNLTGWQIQTRAGTAVITDTVLLPLNQRVLLNASSLSGTFSLDDVLDTLRLYDADGLLVQTLIWGPEEDWGLSSFPTPPEGASAALYGEVAPGYCMQGVDEFLAGWYFDFTPTPGAPNDDRAVARGMVQNHLGNPIGNAEVAAHHMYGTYQTFSCPWDNLGGFKFVALTPGTYLFTAWHPELGADTVGPVELSPGDTATITLVLEFTAVAENPVSPLSGLRLQVQGQTVALTLETPREVRLILLDKAGRLARVLFHGKAEPGTHLFALRNLRKGVYLVRAETPAGSVTRKVLVP